MENTIFLRKYVAAVNAQGVPVEERRSRTGSIYRAKEMDSGREVAVEVIPASSLNAEVRTQLEAEAASAKELNHANIPALYDFGVEDENLIYVTEDLDGTTLDEWIRDHGPMDSAAVLRVALQILGALGAAAYLRILHHAINPQNVLIVPGQTNDGGWPLVKLLHLIGVAPSAANSLSTTGVPDNSSSFASPEQLQTGAVDFRSEIYSLGCTLFFLLTGAVPFSNAGETPDARQAATRRTIERIRGVPKDARQLLARMLASDPNDRPLDPLATYDVLQESLVQVERSGARARKLGLPATKPLSPISAPVAPRRPLPAKALAIAAALLLLTTLAAVVLPALLRKSGVGRSQSGVEEIGVPVGVPDASAAPVAARAPVETTPAEPIANNDTAVVANDTDNAQPQTLTSTAGKKETASSADRSAELTANPQTESPSDSSAARNSTRESAEASSSPPARATEQQSQLASVEAAPATPAPTVSVASSDASAGTVVSSTPAAIRQSESEKSVATTESTESARKAEQTDSTSASTSSKKVASKKIPVRRAEPVDDANQPAVPRGAVRAQFIGTTPDGEWVFGLPSEKEGVLKLRESKKSQKRAQRRAPAETELEEEPPPRVLRALPPDE